MKNILVNLGLLSGTVFLFFAAAETGLRLAGRGPGLQPPPIYRPNTNPLIRYELQPGVRARAFRSTVTTNSLGFRSPESDHAKPMIAVLGDSMAFGYGVEDDEAVTARMQAILPEFTVQNTAVPGYHLGQETEAFREKIIPLDPEILVVVFYFNDLDPGTAFLDADGILRAEDWTPGTPDCQRPTGGVFARNPWHCGLLETSAFYKSFTRLANTLYGRRTLRQERAESGKSPQAEHVSQEQLDAYEHQLDVLMTLVPKDFPRLFVLWPDRFFHPEATPALVHMARERGFSVLNLYNYFGNEVPTLSWDTVHTSPAALARIAELIVGQMKSDRVIP